MLNPIFWKKVQGQKHPGRWGIVEYQIPSIKVLFKTNTKGHKHPSIRLLSKSKTQLVNQRKQKVAFSPGTAHSPEIQSYRTWRGAIKHPPRPVGLCKLMFINTLQLFVQPRIQLLFVDGHTYCCCLFVATHPAVVCWWPHLLLLSISILLLFVGGST